MRAIFISYRRSDAEGQAGRLFDDLKQHFGEDAVFMDVAGLEAGRDFRRAIDDNVASCGVLLAVIGKQWLSATDEHGSRRLDDPMDFVRLETASALKRDIPVVPVLVQGAAMPRSEELPDSLKDLSYRNCVELTHARWDSDVQVLIKSLRPFVQVASAASVSPRASTAPASSSKPSSSSRLAAIAGVAVLVSALGGYAWYHNSQPSGEGESTRPAEPPPAGRPDLPSSETNTPPVVQPPGAKLPSPAGQSSRGADASPGGQLQTVLTFRDWEGTWNLKWEYEKNWYERVMSVKATPSGITGDYVNGTLEGRFVDGDFAKVTGGITNTTGTGTTCPTTGKQTGSFLLTLTKDGRSMDGWWDVCSEGMKWAWKAEKR